MVNKVLSTKITDEEHQKILEKCNKSGCTISEFLRKSIMEKIESETKLEVQELSTEEIKKILGIK